MSSTIVESEKMKTDDKIRDDKRTANDNGVKDMENTSFKSILEEGTEKFECELCARRFTKVGSVKHHITTAHVKKMGDGGKRKNDNDVVNEEEDDELKRAKISEEAGLTESILMKWDEEETFVTSTQKPKKSLEDIIKQYEVDDAIQDPLEDEVFNDTVIAKEDYTLNEELEKMKGTVGQMKEELESKNTLIEILKDEKEKLMESIETKDGLYTSAIGRINELELNMIKKNNDIERLGRVVRNMSNTIEKNSISAKSKEVEDLKGKLRKANDTIKEKEKERSKLEIKNDVLSNNMTDLTKKVAEESNARAKAEGEAIRAVRVNQQLEELNKARNTNMSTTSASGNKMSPASIKEKCRIFEAGRKCKYGKDCYRIHPVKVCKDFVEQGVCSKNNCIELHNNKEVDCRFWKSRRGCDFDDDQCYMRHDPSKKWRNQVSESNIETSQIQQQKQHQLQQQQQMFFPQGAGLTQVQQHQVLPQQIQHVFGGGQKTNVQQDHNPCVQQFHLGGSKYRVSCHRVFYTSWANNRASSQWYWFSQEA